MTVVTGNEVIDGSLTHADIADFKISGSFGTNTAVGSSALKDNTTGFSNTASGVNALRSNTTGNANTAIGRSALRFNTTGSDNIALGSRAGFNLTNGSNNIMIGNEGVAGEANTIRLGTPGTHTQTHLVGTVFTPSGTVTTSSRRFKENIQPLQDVSLGLDQLEPVTYFYKEGYGDGGKSLQHGLIAEDVAKIFPELVVFNQDGTVEGIRYGMLTPMLLSELQKVKAQKDAEIAALKAEKDAEIAALQKRLALLEGLAGRLASIEAKLGVPAAAGEEQK